MLNPPTVHHQINHIIPSRIFYCRICDSAFFLQLEDLRQHRSNFTFLLADVCAGVYSIGRRAGTSTAKVSISNSLLSMKCFRVCAVFVDKNNMFSDKNNKLPVRAHDDTARDVSERQDLITHSAVLGKQHEQDNQRGFIDAELHEELMRWGATGAIRPPLANPKLH